DVLRIGHTWLVFAASTRPRSAAPLRPMAGARQDTAAASARATAEADSQTVRQRDSEETARLTLIAGGRLAGSTSEQTPLAPGHALCGMRRVGARAAPLHLLFRWVA